MKDTGYSKHVACLTRNHGRLKVKTTAQQQEEKRKEREQKLKLFRKANAKVLQKRENKEFDEEALGITGQLLVANPDYYTLWNYRKEIFEHMKSEQPDSFQRLCCEELYLTENCLAKNYKSYGAWHHRVWILEMMPTPDWERELKHCDSFLQLDERNFHGWDHRRKICKLAQTNPEEELKFTLKKIESNFSNYSAWHYRSSLLPLVYPGPNETKSVREDKLLQEYNLVQNAAFTDPSDQSAWFYHRWLLGRAEQRRELVLLYVSRDRNMVFIVLSKPLKVGEEERLELRIDHESITQCWETLDTCIPSSSIWVHKLPASSKVPVQVQVFHHSEDAVDNLECILEREEKWVWLTNANAKLYRSEQSAAEVQVLEQELESCQQLQDLEPNNKWTILTCVLLMRALDIQRHHSLILESLEKLESVDSTRRTYYQDFRSKCVIENALDMMDLNHRKLCLSGQKLTTLVHIDHLILMQEVDLSNNRISSVLALRHLLCVQKLNLDDNKIKDCSGLERLQELELLSLKNNDIENGDSLRKLKSCSKLRILQLEGNPFYSAGVHTDNPSSFLETL